MLDPTQSLQEKRHIGVIPENLALFDNLTAIEYLVFIGRVFGLERQTIPGNVATKMLSCFR